MIWFHALALVMSFTLAAPAFALKPVTCSEKIMAQKPPPGLGEALRKMHGLGIRALLADVDQQKVSLSVQRKWFPWQQTVSARIGWTGAKEIILRGKIDLSTPALEEKFMWDLATALFQLQMQPWMWSRTAMIPRAEVPGLEALLTEPGVYLAQYMPKAWRDQYLVRAETLLRELYMVFISFRELKAIDIMPEKDPGRNWVLHALVMSDGSQVIGPNVEDLETLKRRGAYQLQQSVTNRNSRSVLFNYYMAHMKRAMIITSTATTLFLLPQIANYHETSAQISASEQRLESAPTRALETENATLEHRRQRDIAMVEAALKSEQDKPSPDADRLAQLKAQLQMQLELAPGGIYAKPRE